MFVWHPDAVLDREDDAALAEIEAALRRDDPAFVLLIERLEHDPLGVPGATRISEARSTANDADPGEIPAPGRPSGQPTPSADQPAVPHVDPRFEDRFNPQGHPGSSASARAMGLTPDHGMGPLAPEGRARRAGIRRWMLLVLGTASALALTVLVAALAGPDVGGLVGVVSITGATFLGYRHLAGCPAHCSRSA